MAQTGSLFKAVQRLLREQGPEPFIPGDLPEALVTGGLAGPPLPVRLETGPDGAVTVGLLVTLAAVAPADREPALRNLAEHGFRLTTWTGRIAAGSASVYDLDNLEEVDDDLLIEAANVVHPELDASVPEVWNQSPGWPVPAQGGAGVVIGIVDAGLDVSHPSLRTSTGATRILRLWDQAVRGVAPPPAAYPNGGEWDGAAIDAHLSTPGAPPFPATSASHGTAVAGVAASNGLGAPAGRYVGVAPEADLVVVNLNARRGAFPSTDNVLDAVAYVFATADALGRRAVVNLSQGAQLGPHDPDGLLETGLSDLLAQDDKRILVTSMGNVGDADAHARIDVPHNGTVDLGIDVPAFAGPFVAAELWFDAADLLGIEVLDPSGNAAPIVDSDQQGSGWLGAEIYGVEGTPNFKGVRANQILVTLRAVAQAGNVTSGRWTLRLHGYHVTGGTPVHAWLERGLLASPRFLPPHADPDCTATQPATADEILAVGAYATSPARGRFADLSSRGPDRRGRALQALSAPGDPVTSCTAAPFYATTTHASGSGTSYAAAHVAGAIALLLEADPSLTRKQAVDCLLRTARTDADTAAGPATGWGAGKLDVPAALGCASSINP